MNRKMKEEKALKYFSSPSWPTMTELVYWFQTEFPDYAEAMKNSDHAAVIGEVNAYHAEGSVWTHTMMVCQEAKNDHLIVKLAALLHDIGKPLAREVIDAGTPKPSMNGEERKSTGEKAPRDGRKKISHFRGHEGISFWYSIEVLYELKRMGVINKKEMDEVLNIISLHGVLFNRIKDGKEFKPAQVTYMFDDDRKFSRFVKQCRNDSLGRFYLSDAGSRADVATELGKSLYNDTTWHNYRKPEDTTEKTSTLTVLVGLPACGKSTWIKENVDKDTVIVSKDEEVLKLGRELGLDENYTDIYKALTKELHDLTYQRAIKTFNKAKKDGKNIVIDMTNMSKKSRNKWLNGLKKNYRTEAKVFLAGKSILDTRNIMRSQFENKHIPDYVYENMMKQFLVPTTYEFDNVEFIHVDGE